MRIGELARQAGVNIDTVRYYERSGVLPAPARSASGYRDYDATDLARLHGVRRAKHLGFTLNETVELLALDACDAADMAPVRAAAAAKLADVQARIEQLTRVRDALHALVDACPGHGARSACPILRAFHLETGPAPAGDRTP